MSDMEQSGVKKKKAAPQRDVFFFSSSFDRDLVRRLHGWHGPL